MIKYLKDRKQIKLKEKYIKEKQETERLKEEKRKEEELKEKLRLEEIRNFGINRAELNLEYKEINEIFKQNCKKALMKLYIAMSITLAYLISFILDSVSFSSNFTQIDTLKLSAIALIVITFLAINNTAIQLINKDAHPTYKVKFFMLIGATTLFYTSSQIAQYFDQSIYILYVVFAVLTVNFICYKNLQRIMNSFLARIDKIRKRAEYLITLK